MIITPTSRRAELRKRLGELTAKKFLLNEELKQIQDEAAKVYRELADQ